MSRIDPHEGERGKWDVSGAFWWCDCPGKNPDTRRKCTRCCVYRPWKGTQRYSIQQVSGTDGGFMPLRDLRPVGTK